MNSYDKLYGRLREDRESEAIDLLGQIKSKMTGDPLSNAIPVVQLQAAQTMGEAQARGIRPSWDDFYFQMAELASTMATCPRAHCGAVIVRHKRPLSIGFNGAPAGESHCPSEGETLAEHLAVNHCGIAVHAEVNALKNAVGNVYGATIYVYGHYAPCINCRGELARVGITDIRHRPGPHYGVNR